MELFNNFNDPTGGRFFVGETYSLVEPKDRCSAQRLSSDTVAQRAESGPSPVFAPPDCNTIDIKQSRRCFIKELKSDGATVPEIMRRMNLSKASVYRALNS